MKFNYISIGKRLPLILMLVMAFCCFANTINATTYYISTKGSDATGTGTIANPWKTLSKATSTVTAVGDIIHINAGTYTETQVCYLAVGVSIEGDGVTSIIKSTLNANYTAIINASSPEGTKANQHISNIKLDGNNRTTKWAVLIHGRSKISMYNCTVVNFDDAGVFFVGRTDFNQQPPGVYAVENSFHDNIMDNNAFADGQYGRGALQFGGQDGMLIYNNNITETGRTPGTQGWPIKNCGEGYTKNCKIYNNVLKRGAFPYVYNGENNYWNFAIELFNEQGLEIYGNTVEGSIDMNDQTKGTSAYSVYIHDNIIGHAGIANVWEDGIILEAVTNDAIVEKNIIKNCMTAITLRTSTGGTLNNIRINNNLAYNIGFIGSSRQGYAIRVMTAANNYSCNNIQVLNNTFIALPGADAPYYGMDLPTGTSAVNLGIKNNIFQGFYNYVITAENSSVVNNLKIQNNNFYNNGNNNAIDFLNGAPANYTNSGNTFTNPLFLSATDFHLQSVSPAINTGVYVGLPYSGIAPDKGYAEAAGALPVKLINFTVTENKGKNILQWTTETEINSNYFTIERSNNALDYTPLGRVNALGFTSSATDYTFTDASPLNGINYYRLNMVDKDNSQEYSNVVSISVKKNQSLNIVTAQLSSAKNNVLLTVSATQNKKANLAIFDGAGKIILNETVFLQNGLNTITKNIPVLAKGIYYIKLLTEDEIVVKNILCAD